MSDTDLRGAQGVQGIQGIQGIEGQAGGKQGPPGPPGKALVTRWQVIAVAAFVLFAFLVLAVRTEHNSNRIDANTLRIEVSQWESCVRGRAILEGFNRQQHDLAEIDRQNPGINDKIRRERIEVYERGVFPVPTCGPRPG